MADAVDPINDRPLPSRGLFAALLPAHTGQALTISLTAPVIPMIAVYLGGGKSGDLSAQIIAVTPFLGLMAGGVASGWLIGALGLRPFVLLAASLFAVGGATGLFATGFAPLLLASLILGLAAVFVLTGLSSLTAIAYDVGSRGRVIGLQAGIAGLSNIVCGLGGAFLAERFGWRVPFGIFLGFGTVVLILTLLFIPRAEQGDEHPPIALREIVRRIWPLMLAGGIAFMLIVSQSTQLPFLMADRGISSPGLRGVALTTLAGTSMLASVGYGGLQQRISRGGLTLLIGAAGIAAWTLFGLWTGGLGWAILGAALIGLAQGVLIPMLFGGVMRAVPAEAGGPAVGLLNVAVCFGSFLNPLLSSPIREAAGLPGLMFVLAGVTAVAMIVALSWRMLTAAARPAHRLA